jgi:hypothetical protein
MRGVAELRRVGRSFAGIVLAGLLLAGCKTVQGGPDRLYTPAEEVALARTMLDVAAPDGIPGLVERYYRERDEGERKFIRNDIIARRMYIIDVEYSEYEESLTSERQKFGFLTTAAATALGIASTLTTPVRSAQIVSGVGTAVLASRGIYDSEVVIAKTLQIVQGYMRAARDNVASRQILTRLNDSTTNYPLSAALHDLEDYYRAGTFTAGLIPALRESGAAAELASLEKVTLVRGSFNPDEESSVTLRSFLQPGGKTDQARRRQFNKYLRAMGYQFDVMLITTNSKYAGIRQQLITYARSKGEKI